VLVPSVLGAMQPAMVLYGFLLGWHRHLALIWSASQLFLLYHVLTAPYSGFSLALAAVRFTQHKHYINPSRISPLVLHSTHTSHDGSRSQLYANRRIAVCLSSILVVESHLLSPTDRGLRNKFIKGTLHHQEMQRFVAVTCMIFNQPILHAQIERDSMIFSTMGNWRSTGLVISIVSPPRF